MVKKIEQNIFEHGQNIFELADGIGINEAFSVNLFARVVELPK